MRKIKQFCFKPARICAAALGALLLPCPAFAQQPSPAPQAPRPQAQTLQEKCDALKLALLKDAYDWHVYAQIGDLQMEMNRPRAAAASYEKALAIFPLTRERGAEMRQAEFIAAQASAEQQRQSIAKEAAQKQAQDAEMASTMQVLSMLPGGGSAKAIMLQQGLSAAATMSQGASQYGASMAQGEIAGIANPVQQVSYSLPEKQESAGLWIKLGKAYDAYGEHERAGASFEQGGSIDPARFDAIYLTGVSLLSMGHGTKALVAANRYLAMMPGDPPPPVCMLLGDAFRSLGMWKESKTAYAMAAAPFKRASELKPGDAPALLQLANLQAKACEYADAAASFKRVFSADRSPAALGGLSVCLMSLEDSEALKALLPELQSKAIGSDDWYVLARVQDFLGEELSAKASYAKSVELWEKANPSKERQTEIVAVARAGAGSPEEAVAFLKEHIDRDPCAPDVYLDFFRLGIALEKLKGPSRPDLAAEAFRQCLEDTPSYLQAAVALKRLTGRLAPQAAALLAQSDEALKASEKAKGAVLRAQAWSIMPDGPERDKALQETLEIVKDLPPQEQPLPKEAADAWLEGNAIFASKKSLGDLRKAALQFRHAFVLAPWNTSLLLNLAACHSALDRGDLAKKELSAALRHPGGNTQENLAKLFEYERQRSLAERERRDLNPFKSN